MAIFLKRVGHDERGFASHPSISAVDIQASRLSTREIHRAISHLGDDVLAAIDWHQKQVKRLAREELSACRHKRLEVIPGLATGYQYTPYAHVGCLIPSDHKPLIALTNRCVVSAKVANVGRISVCLTSSQPKPNPITVASAALAGADDIYYRDEASAVAMLTQPNHSTSPVELIIGRSIGDAEILSAQAPPHTVVNLAHSPRSVLFILDEFGCEPVAVAEDIIASLSQDTCQSLVLLMHSAAFAACIVRAVNNRLSQLPDHHEAVSRWARWGQVMVVDSLDLMVAQANKAHTDLIKVMMANPKFFQDNLNNYDRLVLGQNVGSSMGDVFAATGVTQKASPKGHTLWMQMFFKLHTYQRVKPSLQPMQEADSQCFAALERGEEGMALQPVSAQQALSVS